jgi:hypothetical protein
MTATAVTAPNHDTTSQSRTSRHLWRTGTVAGLAAAAATSVFAVATDAVGVSLKVSGESIPVLGFAQVTFVAALIGTILAVVLAGHAQHAARTFVRSTIALTVLSFVPDVFADAATSTRVALALSHVVAAVIVIPALAARLSD